MKSTSFANSSGNRKSKIVNRQSKIVSIIFAFCLLFGGKTWGQGLDTYTFATGTSGTIYSPSWTTICASGNDDIASTVQSIGFTFKYDGTDYTQFSANSNGRMRLGGDVISTAYNNPFTSGNYSGNTPAIAGVGRDCSTGSAGYVKTGLYGSSGSYIRVIEFMLNTASTASGTTYIKFQVQLFQANNEVRIVYSSDYSNAPSSYQIGIGNASYNKFWYVNPSAHTATYSTTYTADTYSVFPGGGRYYSFVPPATVAPAASVPYSHNFENTTENGKWTLKNDTYTNKWMIGTGTYSSSSRSLYVSNGSANEYTNTSASSYVYAYRKLNFSTAGDYTVSFKWKARGEGGCWDAMYAALVPPGTACPPASDITGSSNTLPTGYINVGDVSQSYVTSGAFLWKNAEHDWISSSKDVTISTAGEYYLVFYWKNDGSGGNNPPAAVDDISVTQAVRYTLTGTANPSAGGTVSPTSGEYTQGTAVSISATTNTGYRFTGWTKTGAGTFANANSASTTFTMGAGNATVTANFTRLYTLTVNAGAGGTVSPTSGSYAQGETVSITATPSAPYNFSGWTVSGSGASLSSTTANPTTFTMGSANATVTASFTAKPTHTLTVDRNNTAGGTVSGSGTYYEGQTASITATPASGYYFANWTGATVANANNASTTYTMGTANATVTANFFPVESAGGSAADCGPKLIYVSTTGSDSNNGSSTAPVLTISKALTLATGGTSSNPAIIRVASGTYDINAPLNLVSNIIIDGQWSANTTTGVWTKGTTATIINRTARSVEGTSSAPRIVAIEGTSKSYFKLQDIKVTTESPTTSTLTTGDVSYKLVGPREDHYTSYAIAGSSYTHNAAIYPSSMVGLGACTFTGLAYYFKAAATITNLKIYLKEVDFTTVSMSTSNWNTLMSGAQLVYQGSVTANANEQKTFNISYEYSGGNLLVLMTGTNTSTGANVNGFDQSGYFIVGTSTAWGHVNSFVPAVRIYSDCECVTASDYGISTYAVHLNGCSNYEFVRCQLLPGNASAGRTGTDGNSGTSATSSTAVGSGNQRSGAGATSGSGSNAAQYNSTYGGGGSVGGAGSNGASVTYCKSTSGGNGITGGSGKSGIPGTAGTDYIIVNTDYSTYFTPKVAGDGAAGGGGGGGGKGGTGGTSHCANALWSTSSGSGGAGGNGGAGGSGGFGGTGGFGGGSSFGVYHYGSTSLGTFTDCYIVSGTGGAGGTGGTGGNGGSGYGGDSGSSGSKCSYNCGGTVYGGTGGHGGSGGSGGKGGAGGKGADGVSYKIAVVGTSGLNTSQSTTSGYGTAPNTAIASIDYGSSSKQGCTNSQISLSKASGSWASGQYGTLIKDKNSSTSSYTTSSTSIITGYGSTGTYTPVSGGSRVFISQERTLGTISGPTTICGSSENYTYGGSLSSGDVLLWSLLSTDGNTQYDSRVIAYSGSQTPYTINPESLGLAAGTYNIKLMVKSNCCGMSIPIWLTVTVGEVPNAPTGLTVSSITTTSATVSWNANGASSWEYSTDGNNWTSTGNTSVSLSGLTPGTAYTFYVKAVNASCESDAATVLFNTLNQYTVTAAKETGVSTSYVALGGTFSGTNTSVTVSHGGSATFQATLTDGYDFDGWYNGNTRVSTSLTYTRTNITGALTLTAKATLRTYTVTAAKETGVSTSYVALGGTFSGTNTSVTVSHGG
ncbi:MAG: fibronectin type III domain-containing protein, partial [Bacteroidales bacterium]|nr:fibronectin type III domain-containing protein [Bacteroidales bacterium]